AIERVIEALQVTESVLIFCGKMTRVTDAVQLMRPYGTSIGEDVHLIEQLAAIPQRLRLILDVRPLPVIDGLTPLQVMIEARFCNLPGVGALCAKESCIVAHPLASASKLN